MRFVLTLRVYKNGTPDIAVLESRGFAGNGGDSLFVSQRGQRCRDR